MHAGSQLRLRKLSREYNPMDQREVLHMIAETTRKAEFPTGLIYVNPVAENFIDLLNIHETPLVHLQDDDIRPGPEALAEAMMELA